jgi:hypothetical protein
MTMSQKFTLTLDLSDHEHPHSPTAQRQIVAQLLQQAAQAVGSGYVDPRVRTGEDGVTKDHPSVRHAWGELSYDGAEIGSWEFSD